MSSVKRSVQRDNDQCPLRHAIRIVTDGSTPENDALIEAFLQDEAAQDASKVLADWATRAHNQSRRSAIPAPWTLLPPF